MKFSTGKFHPFLLIPSRIFLSIIETKKVLLVHKEEFQIFTLFYFKNAPTLETVLSQTVVMTTYLDFSELKD